MAAQPTGNIVTNGGFETGDISDWIDISNAAGITLNVSSSANIPGGSHSGAFSGAVITPAGGPSPAGTSHLFEQNISIPSQYSSTQQYLFQGFVKTVGNICLFDAFVNEATDAGVFLSIVLNPGGATPPWVGFAAVVTPGGSFTLILSTNCHTGDTVWFDDLSLIPIA